MSEIRIKELASAAGQIDKFDEFEFIVDVPSAEASMKIKGRELQERVAPKAHTHPISDVQGLQSSLDKKFDKTGGVISGNLSVEGDAYMRNLRLEEFLEVPEFRYNRVGTTVGDEWSALEKYTASMPEYITINDDFVYIAAYYEARATIVKALHDAAATSTDLEYLRDNFQHSTTEVDGQSGVVLSGFVGVKNESDEKVVAGMAGCTISGATDSRHGKLMFFAGADGIDNAAQATTRIYEDGYVEMGTGVFSGYMRVPFKRLTEDGTDYDAETDTYTVNKNFNLITQQTNFNSYIITIKLPTSAEYIGSVVNIYDYPVRTRSSSNVIIVTDDEESGILCSLGINMELLTCMTLQRVECFGGLIQLIAVPNIYSGKCWWMVAYNSMMYFQKTE